MDLLKAQFARIQQQLGGLNASQKMLAASLVVIMVMTLFWWTTYAGKSEMVVLLDASLSPGDIQAITTHLDARAIKYSVTGDRVRVPADRRYEVLAALQYAELLPSDTKDAFDEMIAKSGPWDSNAKTEKLWNVYKQTTLARIIKGMPGVQVAQVVINATDRRGPGGTSPSASVHIQLKKGLEADEKLVKAAADLVAGSVANLKRSQVVVVVNDRSFALKDREAETLGFGSDDWLATIQKSENYYSQKLRELFPGENVLVAVSARPNNDRTETLERQYDSKNVVHKPLSEETTSDETRTSETLNEPGVVPNGGLSIAEGAASEGSSSTTEKNKSTFELHVPSTEIKRFNAGGDVTILSAVVRIPRSHFVKAFKSLRTTPADKEPEDAVLEPYIAQAISTYRTSVQRALPIAAPESVHVEAYPDTVPFATVEPQAASTTVSLLVSDYYVKEIALGALALISLFMVSTVVKRSSVPVPVAVAGGPKGPPTLHGDEDPLGEAGEGAPLLDGIEMDPDAVKTQEMLAQVGNMVNENPDAAAALIKRWLNR